MRWFYQVLTNCTEYQGRVDQKNWLHIDIKTDDIEKEVTRLENLDASVVEQMSKWTIMEAPSKHHFCIIKLQLDDFEEGANSWTE